MSTRNNSINVPQVKKMCPGRSAKYERQNRIAMGHVQTVEYIVSVYI